MQIERFGHAAIRVRDLAVAESFYGSVLGFAVTHRYAEDHEVVFAVGSHDHLLVQGVGLDAPIVSTKAPGLHHIAFVVAGGEKGLGLARARLERRGVEYRCIDHGEHRSLYLHDPDGNQVELYHARTPPSVASGAATLARARAFIHANARRIDRAAFEVLFEGAPANSLIVAIEAYRNADGGFGHALEPDLRTPLSQPLHTETGLAVLKQAGIRCPDIADACCRYLAKVARADAALPAFTEGALDSAAAGHWQAGFGAEPSLDRTLGSVALLLWHGARHPWLESAKAACLRHLDTADIDEAHHLDYAFQGADALLDGAARLQVLERLRPRLDRAEFFVADTPVVRYGLTPLRFVPTPDSAARAVFDDALIERHLDDLLASQSDDGGWPVRFQPPSEGALIEWRGHFTVEALVVLRAWGRL